METSQIHNIPRFGDRRRSLRNNPTTAEKYLWTFLKGKQMKGRKFRRQHGIANYIVDFYCASENLIIELDGEVHHQPGQIIYDRRRDEFLRNLGFRILRFNNDLVFCNVMEVLRLIRLEIGSEEL
ncbi:endonuclease domain-containing protein [Daejeonella sp.]|uniref:endonuclease domain-containing protein n=1 Tax=Daejeonella sp. TaxID=2805397 RepID=UPI00398355EB